MRSAIGKAGQLGRPAPRSKDALRAAHEQQPVGQKPRQGVYQTRSSVWPDPNPDPFTRLTHTGWPASLRPGTSS